MNKLLIITLLALLATGLQAQQIPRPPVGAAPLRSEFIPFDTREGAETFDHANSADFIPLLDSMQVDEIDGTRLFSIEKTFPLTWIEREIYLHIEGASAALVRVNGAAIGATQEHHTPTEFLISPQLREGGNRITIAADTLTTAYIYSQPPLHIRDFTLRADLDEAKLSLEVITANSFNYSEKIDVGYDIFDPAGKLVYYDKRERTLAGRGVDTMRFSAPIPGVQAWSPEAPKRYRVMLILWREGRIVEYIPLKIGFRKADFDANLEIVRTARSVEWGAFSPKAKVEMTTLKKQGIKLLRTTNPQPAAFYDLCDELGFWVVDQADIPAAANRLDRRVGGAPGNDPAYLPAYLYRAEAMYQRAKNHTSIVGWSLGGDSGNGYTMYRIYLRLKELGALRPVIYRDAQGEWNTDM